MASRTLLLLCCAVGAMCIDPTRFFPTGTSELPHPTGPPGPKTSTIPPGPPTSSVRPTPPTPKPTDRPTEPPTPKPTGPPTSTPTGAPTSHTPTKAPCVPDCSRRRSGSLLPDPKSCSFYYECANGAAVRMPCPAGLEFSARFKKCLWPAKAHCKPRKDCDHFLLRNPTSSKKPMPTTKKPMPTTKKPMPTTTTHHGTTLVPCPPQCDGVPDGTLFPDPRNCEYFYECAEGAPVHEPCPPGLQFSDKMKMCTWAKDANCTENHHKDCNSLRFRARRTTKSLTPMVTTLPACIPDCHKFKEGTLLPNQRNCSEFYECAADRALKFHCPDGLKFSVKYKQCMWAKEADCTENHNRNCNPFSLMGPKPTPPPKPTPTKKTTPHTTTHHGTTLKPCPANCVGQPDGKLFPDIRNCHGYYECSDELPIWEPCPITLEFSAKLSACTYPKEANCTEDHDPDCPHPHLLF